MIKLFQINKYLIALAAFCIFSSCHGQSGEIDSCKLDIKNARRNINVYYQNKDRLLLLSAMNYANRSLQCKETRRGSVEIKLSIFVFLKEYKAGQVFLDSLDENDFKLKYKKLFWYDYFAALDAESHSDSINRVKYYYEIVQNVENYIKTENDGKNILNKEAYYDLFYIKEKITDHKKLYKQIDILEKEYPSENIFFESLKSTFDNTTTNSEALPN